MQVLEGLQRFCVNLDTVTISKHVQAEVDRQAIFSKRLSFSNGKILVVSDLLERTVPFIMLDRSPLKSL
jgi:hypothetical protein